MFVRGITDLKTAVAVAATALLACVFTPLTDASTPVGTGQGSPLWAKRPLSSSSRAAVGSVVSTATADVVLLDGGHNEGFRDGMACEVYRGSLLVAELMIVHCETERSAALITALKAGMGIVPGDVANIKTVHSF